MQLRTFSVFSALAAAALVAEPAARPNRTVPGFVAHEWGTFTSVAALDGSPTPWYRPRPDDLPCFVYRMDGGAKAIAVARVRMETPVIYFYAKEPATVSVSVDFPQGLMTEWYPKAKVVPNSILNEPVMPVSSRITWPRVELLAGEKPAFPREAAGNHYYAARETDATPVKVGEQFEKLLFYRGVGQFDVPYSATLSEQGVTFREIDQAALGRPSAGSFESGILLENHGGRLSFRAIAPSAAVGSLPVEAQSPQAALAALEGILVKAGLYPREARAMVETWKDAWLEEGTRILYVVPRPFVDRVLPLSIAPEAAETQRVFMGRLELIAPWVGDEVRRALGEDDVETVKKWDRFWNPIQQQCREKLQGVSVGPRVKAYWQSALPTRCAPAVK